MPRNIITATSLPAPPNKLYDMYLDEASHAAFTGLPVTIEPRADGAFALSPEFFPVPFCKSSRRD